jgi:energy-coupling factor transporter ATP-binding protein EcfA2
MNDLFDNLPMSQIVPRSSREWDELHMLLGSTFSPHKPINDRDLFVGRIGLITKVVDSVFQSGKHVVLYGDRGVGKSSLANSLKSTLMVMANNILIEKRSCTVEHDFNMIWHNLLDDFYVDGKPAREILPANLNPYDVYKFVQYVPEHQKIVFIIDEFDRITDTRTKQLLSDLVKMFSDGDDRTTIILVGVAKSISELFANHASLPRAMQQIYMPRMDHTELRQIISTRLPTVGMSIEEEALNNIVAYSQGFPGFTHLMGLTAARVSTVRRSTQVSQFDLKEALKTVVEEADEAVTTDYHKAIQSTKAKNQYREVLLACALAPTDERNRFTAKGVGAQLSKILGYEVAMTSFGRNIEQFCAMERGPALVREGSRKNYHYYFDYALLKPYVVIKGLSDGLSWKSSPII